MDNLHKAVLIQEELENYANRVLILKKKLKQFCEENNISKSSVKKELKIIKKKYYD